MYIYISSIVSSCKWYKAYVVTIKFRITIAAEKNKSCRRVDR